MLNFVKPFNHLPKGIPKTTHVKIPITFPFKMKPNKVLSILGIARNSAGSGITTHCFAC